MPMVSEDNIPGLDTGWEIVVVRDAIKYETAIRVVPMLVDFQSVVARLIDSFLFFA
jgi:hypothetical protein